MKKTMKDDERNIELQLDLVHIYLEAGILRQDKRVALERKKVKSDGLLVK